MARRSRYFVFLAVQTLGATVLFWYAVPLYREVWADPAGHEVHPERLIWALSSIGLLQIGYWMRHRFNPPLPQFRNAFVGHIILFVGRISFVFASAVFGFTFLIPRPELHIPTSRYVLLVVGLFALFCYVQELDRLGRVLNERKQQPPDVR